MTASLETLLASPPPAADSVNPQDGAAFLSRETFTTNRLLEYFGEKELVLQTGHDRDAWPDVIIKELVDNALDAAEGAGVAPIIEVAVAEGNITVTDNGPGIAPEVVGRILDFDSKTSSKDFYISPTRGAQGNALKTVLGIVHVLGGAAGQLEIESQGIKHLIGVTVNRIKQEPVISHEQTPSDVKSGAAVRVELACLNGDGIQAKFLQRVESYRLLNPHLTVQFSRAKTPECLLESTDAAWAKWRPSDPISAHWYDPDQFCGLIAAYLAREQDGAPARYVRDFIAGFRGLSSTARQKALLAGLNLTGAKLSALAKDGDIDRELAGRLLQAMKAATRPVKPQDLGMIGEDHIRGSFEGRGCNPYTVRYKRMMGVDGDARPYVIEVAFGVFEDRDKKREVVTGLNFSPCIANPFNRLRYTSLLGDLEGSYVDHSDPCLVLVHLAAPYLQYSDRGKSAVELPDEVGEAISNAVRLVCVEWDKIETAKIRSHEQAERLLKKYSDQQNQTRTLKDVVFENLPSIYATVTGNKQYAGAARQLFYAMRTVVLRELPEKELDDVYFTQNLLPAFMREHSKLSADWDVIYDDRGHFTEPHTELVLGLGTRSVRRYLNDFSMPDSLQNAAPHLSKDFHTVGPEGRYRNVLFIEKEGFLEILAQARIAERFDLAIMSSKGISSTAARTLMEKLPGIRFFVLHDFDKSGFSIVGTLTRDTIRYQFENPPEVIDLGLRLEDVRRLKLASEPVQIKPEAADNLRANGAIEDEIQFLLGDGEGSGQRVELNAMTSPQLITWLEGKLKKHHVKKFMPDNATLQIAFKRAALAHGINRKIDEIFSELREQADEADVPGDLQKQVLAYLKKNPGEPWDVAVAAIAGGADE